jgi:hypothetical protein
VEYYGRLCMHKKAPRPKRHRGLGRGSLARLVVVYLLQVIGGSFVLITGALIAVASIVG